MLSLSALCTTACAVTEYSLLPVVYVHVMMVTPSGIVLAVVALLAVADLSAAGRTGRPRFRRTGPCRVSLNIQIKLLYRRKINIA